MAMLCFIGRHEPSSCSVAHSEAGAYVALCASCGLPLELPPGQRRWRAAPSLLLRAQERIDHKR